MDFSLESVLREEIATQIEIKNRLAAQLDIARTDRSKIKPYLCGPINGCTDSEANDWREAVINVFPLAINPMKRDYRGKELTEYREIVDLDKRDIRNSDIVLVNYDKPSVGTSMEIFYAWTLGIPVVVWAPAGVRMSPWMIYHSTAIVHSLDEVVAKLKAIA